MKRVILLVMDSLGIGSASDASSFGGIGFTDEGADTLGHIARTFALAGTPLRLPNLAELGLLESYKLKNGLYPAGMSPPEKIHGAWACAKEKSRGKDTPSGHWEIAGVPVPFDWSYFPRSNPFFPKPLSKQIFDQGVVGGALGNCHGSGTEIIKQFGAEHIISGKPIFYTSADSVFQVAAHETHFGLERLYELCGCIRRLLDASDLTIGRVIARPFTGKSAEDFKRSGNRRDFAIPPPCPTILEKLCEAGGSVTGVGKIADIYAHTGITREVRAHGHPALWKETLSALRQSEDASIVMTNFVDFDTVYGHRRDAHGYGRALEEFDSNLPVLLSAMHPGDLLIITADHGNDPTWPGSDHTREDIPILLTGDNVPAGTSLGTRNTFADIGQTIAGYFSLEPFPNGTSLI